MSNMKTCVVCGRGFAEGLALFRVNRKGIPGEFACRQHFHVERARRGESELEEEFVLLTEKITEVGRGE